MARKFRFFFPLVEVDVFLNDWRFGALFLLVFDWVVMSNFKTEARDSRILEDACPERF